jgi:hypothetical protein
MPFSYSLTIKASNPTAFIFFCISLASAEKLSFVGFGYAVLDISVLSHHVHTLFVNEVLHIFAESGIGFEHIGKALKVLEFILCYAKVCTFVSGI